MTDFETHPAGTAARIKQLEANTKELGDFLAAYMAEAFTSGRTATELREALTRANAATAAAHEVAAKAVTDAKVFSETDTAEESAAKVVTLGRARRAIRALATPDQTAALDRLIAEAEARGKTLGVATEKIRRLVEWLQDDEDNVFLLPHDDVVKMRAILAASKKGGV